MLDTIARTNRRVTFPQHDSRNFPENLDEWIVYGDAYRLISSRINYSKIIWRGRRGGGRVHASHRRVWNFGHRRWPGSEPISHRIISVLKSQTWLASLQSPIGQGAVNTARPRYAPLSFTTRATECRTHRQIWITFINKIRKQRDCQASWA